MSLTQDDAMELVDTFGSDPKRWPLDYKANLDALMASDDEFREYVEEMQELDGMLDEWEDSEDGDGVGIEDSDSEHKSKDWDGDSDEEDEDDGEDDADDEDLDGDDDEEGDDSHDAKGDREDDDAEQERERPTAGTEQEEEQPEEGFDDGSDDHAGQGAPLEVIFEDLKDTDSALEEVIREMMFGGFDASTQTHLTRDYDVIAPYEAPAHVDGLAKIEAEVKAVAGSLQKNLQRIMVARSQSYFVGGHRSGRLNAPALHRLKVNDDRVFRRKHVAQTNKVAVSLLVDLSGSMRRDEKVETALKSAWAFSEALDKIGVPNEVIGFTSGDLPSHVDAHQFYQQMHDFYAATGLPDHTVRINPMWMPIFKGYAEKFGPAVKRRLAHMTIHKRGMGENNDAAAIEFAGERLRMRQETRKIMIVFSDGAPADSGIHYACLNNSVKAQIAKLERQGMEVIGIGIQDSSVKHFYSKAFVVKNVKDLPKFVMKELKDLLTH